MIIFLFQKMIYKIKIYLILIHFLNKNNKKNNKYFKLIKKNKRILFKLIKQI